MKKEYLTPNVDISSFLEEDIVRTSGEVDGETLTPMPEDWYGNILQ